MNEPTPARISAVTGASRGIGRETALALAQRGDRVFALARSGRELETLAQSAASQGWRIDPIIMDIADESSRTRAIESIMASTDGYGLDVLVNNAGYGYLGPVEELSLEGFRRQLEVNLVALLACTQPFLPHMRRRHRGRIVNISSAAGRVATPFMGAYSASKFALEALSDSLRVELMPFGVHVILIEPGPIRTSFGLVAAREVDPESPYARYERQWHAARSSSNLFERSATSVAGVIVRSVEAQRPRARYTVTLSAKAGGIARRIMPDRVMDSIFGRALGAGG